MSSAAAFDIRYPIGGMFVVLALLLIPYGLFIQPARTAGDGNIDLWWGLFMLLFGLALLALAHLGKEDSSAPENN